jgi:exopolyphosphatase/guanosine-5'-triphosphate,3'-diphosphate pyrophosphatase
MNELLPRGSASAAAPELCVIDMGSNSFRRIVGSFAAGKFAQRAIDVRTLGVGDDVVKHGRISEAKLAEIETTLAAFKAACDKDGASPIAAVGTAAFREAPNGRRVIEIAAKVGVPMEIATEQRESELAYLVGALGRDGYAVIDNGSRSVELVAKDQGRLRHHVFNFGYRLAYERFFASAAEPAPAVQAFRRQLLEEAAKAPFMKGKTALAVVEFGEMAAVLFEPAAVEGRVFTAAQLKTKVEEIGRMRSAEFQALKKKKDIDRALPRLIVAATLMDAFGYATITLTDRELGAGLIIEAGSKGVR